MIENVVVADVPAAPPQTPSPNFDDKEGDTYLYVAAVSEEERKTGKSAGDVVMFRYLGEEDGIFRIASVGENGALIGVSECSRECKIIRTKWSDGSVRRIGFDAGSIIGSAFEDAFNGHLQPARQEKVISAKAAPSEDKQVIPSAYMGEWNADVATCGTGPSESRLRIEPTRLSFYESVGNVQKVVIHDGRSLTVTANFSGEGVTWSASDRMELSPSGDKLTIDGITRQRCR